RTEKAAKIKIHLPLEDFLASVRQVRIMTDEQSKRVDIAFRPGTAVLESRGAATGAGQVELSLPDFTGPAIRVAFDPDFLVDYLNVVRGEEPASSTRGRASAQPPQNPTTDTAATQTGQVVLELVAPDKPALFRYGDDWVYVVMPMVQS
ncbi:MAG: hypothetical protein NZ703_06295, partial [Gemmataceae bacterium]|nr:hypothetical protein [Gemmataceae bacterium]